MSQGFTLIEMLIALAILGLLVAVARPNAGAGGTASAISAARLLAADLARARSQAEAANHDVVVVIDVRARSWSGAGRDGSLPEHLRLAVTAADSERLDSDRAGIRFYAEGGASGGRIAVLGASPATIDIDWLTGRVSLHDR